MAGALVEEGREWDGQLRSAVEAFWGAGIYQLLQYGWGHNHGGLQLHRGVQALIGGPQGLALSMMGEKSRRVSRGLSGFGFWSSGSCWTLRGQRGRILACGQLLTHPDFQKAVTEGIVPLAGSPHHYAVLTLPCVVGLPGTPVAGTRDTSSHRM